MASTIMSLSIIPYAAHAEQAPTATELMEMLLELKKEQSALSQKINAVESLLERSEASQNTTTALPASNVSISRPKHAPTEAEPNNNSSQNKKLNVSGDIQLRYESNFSDADAAARNRGAMRGRLRAEYALSNFLAVGAEISTGDSNDPNSRHVTLSSFVNDLDVSLTKMYVQWNHGPLEISGGKFTNPFMRTDIVWDGDVNPQGASASYTLPFGSNASLKASGLYFLIDEASAGPDSDMIGGQVKLSMNPSNNWRIESAVAYYDYNLQNLASADAGDFRSNLRNGTGGYLSDFDLLDIVTRLSYSGLGAQWPVSVTANYVKNFGAATNDDQGYSVDFSLGKAKTPGDWRFVYEYSQVDVDAVLAAFSNDNLGIATNYQSNKISISYVPVKHLQLNATLYHYKPLDRLFAGVNDPNDWLDRLRLNMTVAF